MNSSVNDMDQLYKQDEVMKETKPFQIPKSSVKEAWLRVKANKGSEGIDNETIEAFEAKLTRNLYKIWNRM